ncbi:Hypp5778 [Branchiostoma lanceolatum]|uniref:Hypp5778 protein n=1 Tax=Branchiostoma lanceolatum TaxID=7740 RepID=A0A8J9YRP8_BRALA|nr:Hypp5778 [Branchiostoma lanceolatum]
MLLVFILLVVMTTDVTPITHRHVGPVLAPRIMVPGDESEDSGESGDGDNQLTSDPDGGHQLTSDPDGDHELTSDPNGYQQLTSEPAFQPTVASDRSPGTISAEKDDEEDFLTYKDAEETKEVLSTGVAETVSFTDRPHTTIASTVRTNGYISTAQQRTVGVLSSKTKRTSGDNRGRESNVTKDEVSFCPAFCCSSNVTCRYDFEVLPICACNKAGPYETCELSNGDNPIWADVLKMAPDRKRGVCMELWDRDQNNVTRYRLHCHVTGVQDFTYTSVHWNASVPNDAQDKNLPNQRPCLMFIHTAGPPLRNKTAMDETLQYAGFAMIFVFIGVIMCCCRNQETTDEDEPLERKASDAWVDQVLG